MDAKITKKRLSRLFTYDWIKIAAMVLAFIFGWLVIFELTETRIRPSQRFTIFNYQENRSITPEIQSRLERALTEDVFSSEVLEMDIQDLATADMYTYQTLISMLGVSQGDIILLPNITNYASVDTTEGSGTDGKFTYPESLVVPYRPYVTNLSDKEEGGYFYELIQYLNGFYTQGWEHPESIDEAKIETAFKARVKETRDKRYRRKSKLEAGVQTEIDRIKKYRDALAKLYGFIEEGLVCFNAPSHIQGKELDDITPYDGIISLNICPDESKMQNLKKYVSYPVYIYNEDQTAILGVSHYIAQDMSVAFFYGPDTEKTFEYESLLFVVDLIEKGRTTA